MASGVLGKPCTDGSLAIFVVGIIQRVKVQRFKVSVTASSISGQ